MIAFTDVSVVLKFSDSVNIFLQVSSAIPGFRLEMVISSLSMKQAMT